MKKYLILIFTLILGICCSVGGAIFLTDYAKNKQDDIGGKVFINCVFYNYDGGMIGDQGSFSEPLYPNYEPEYDGWYDVNRGGIYLSGTPIYDTGTDLLLYDVKKNEVITVPQLFSDKAFETFPHFSPDGKTLYFCSSEAQKMPEDFQNVKYSLCSISFNPETRTFGTQVDTLFNGKHAGKSVSFPRVSPDGKFLVFTLSDYGNFSIWHKEADLYIANLQDRTVVPLESANSDNVESYHSWSSNSRWLVFSSRRLDGLYTHPHLIHIDAEGKAGKPFILPQKDATFYSSYMQSFNIPEFVKGPVEYSTHDIANSTLEEGKTIHLYR